MPNFFQGFNFDTLLALISCITGIVALFLGGSAYKKCKINKNSFDDNKEYGDNCKDNSQKAGGDIINSNKEYRDNCIDNSQNASGDIVNYQCDIQALANLTRDNFQASLNQAYLLFEKKTEENLHQIIEETQKIIIDNKINIGSYTKIDWINIYFENAKTTSDKYMQNVWAKVLAKEIESPGSFSFQTLNILKNMSAEDFEIFKTMCSLQIDRYLLTGDIYSKYNLEWIKSMRLRELGLLNLDKTECTKHISPHNKNACIYCDEYIVLFTNTSDKDVEHKINIYLLSSSAIELMKIVDVQANENFIIDYAREISRQQNKSIDISVHKIDYYEGNEYNYCSVDLLNMHDERENKTISED